jgi:hypothetical protein
MSGLHRRVPAVGLAYGINSQGKGPHARTDEAGSDGVWPMLKEDLTTAAT